MTYALEFKKTALKEWIKLNLTVRGQFKKKLAERLDDPHIAAARLSAASNFYKIKLRRVGYRLVYSVSDQTVTVAVAVVGVGKRDKNEIYNLALSRLDK